MMAGSNQVDDLGAVAATSLGTALTANGTANTEGTTYTQIIASTTRAYDGLFVQLIGNSATAHRLLLDLAVGAAASEVDVIQDLLFTQTATTALRCPVNYAFLPIQIASGSRLSMRSRASTASMVSSVQVLGVVQQTFTPTKYTKCTTYGADTTDSGGTAIDAGATANTKGAFAVLSSSTADPMKAMVVVLMPSTLVIPATLTTVLIDLAIGAAASEVLVVSNLFWRRSNNVNSDNGTSVGPFLVDIPAGTRVTARCQASSTDADARIQDVVVYGFN